jgi:hypothetical protein
MKRAPALRALRPGRRCGVLRGYAVICLLTSFPIWAPRGGIWRYEGLREEHPKSICERKFLGKRARGSACTVSFQHFSYRVVRAMPAPIGRAPEAGSVERRAWARRAGHEMKAANHCISSRRLISPT